MKTKKSNQANLEKSKGTVRQMGLILALGLVFIAFEYSRADIADIDYDAGHEVTVEPDYVPVTFDIPLPPPPPPPLVMMDIITIVDNTTDIPDDLDIINLDVEDFTPTIFDYTIEDEVDPDAVFIQAEHQPEFPGGESALMQYLGKSVKYPILAMENGIQGRVYVEFVVNKDGSIVDVKILKGVHDSLNQEALRVIKNMPSWKAGIQSGKKVRVSYRIPINFALQ